MLLHNLESFIYSNAREPFHKEIQTLEQRVANLPDQDLKTLQIGKEDLIKGIGCLKTRYFNDQDNELRKQMRNNTPVSVQSAFIDVGIIRACLLKVQEKLDSLHQS